MFLFSIKVVYIHTYSTANVYISVCTFMNVFGFSIIAVLLSSTYMYTYTFYSMCICIYTYISVCTPVNVFVFNQSGIVFFDICMSIHTHSTACVCMSICTFMNVLSSIKVLLFFFIYTCLYTHILQHVCVCQYVLL